MRAKDIVQQAGGAVDAVTVKGSVLDRLAAWPNDPSMPMPKMILRALRQLRPRPMSPAVLDGLSTTPALRAFEGRLLPSLLSVQEDFDQTALDLEVLIRDRLLVASNLEAQNDCQPVFLLKPDPTCRPLPSNMGGGLDPQGLDPDCVAELPKLQVRIATVREGDATRFKVLLGPDRLELSAILVGPALLAWDVDLAKAKKAADFADQALLKPGEPPSPPFPKLSGTLRVAIKKLGPKKASLEASVLAPIEVEASDSPFGFRTGRADPLISITGDGVARQASMKLALGPTDVRAPWDPRDEGAKNLDLHVSLGGLTGEVLVAEGTKELGLRGLGVGASFVDVRGQHIFELNFNPANGRKADATVKIVGKNIPRVEISPKLDLSLLVRFAPVVKEFSMPPEQFLLDETYSVQFAPAAAPPAVCEMVAPNQQLRFDGGMKIVAGSLKLAARGAPNETVIVPAGKCVATRAGTPPGAHPLLGQFVVTDCPPVAQ